jgi:hypothetical protein
MAATVAVTAIVILIAVAFGYFLGATRNRPE